MQTEYGWSIACPIVFSAVELKNIFCALSIFLAIKETPLADKSSVKHLVSMISFDKAINSIFHKMNALEFIAESASTSI